jgi:hypothetical protein
MSGQDDFEFHPIDEAKREQLRRDPRVRYHRNERPVPFVPTIRAEGVDDIRRLLDRDEDDALSRDTGDSA